MDPPEPLEPPPQICSLCNDPMHRSIHLRQGLRAWAKVCTNVTEAIMSFSDHFTGELDSLDGNTCYTDNPSTLIETTPSQSLPREESQAQLESTCRDSENEASSSIIPPLNSFETKVSEHGQEIFSSPTPSAFVSRRLITSLLSIGRDLVVGGSSSGDLFWWGLPRLTLRGSIPGLHQCAIHSLYRIVNLGSNCSALDSSRVVSVDQSGAIVIIDTSLVQVDLPPRRKQSHSKEERIPERATSKSKPWLKDNTVLPADRSRGSAATSLDQEYSRSNSEISFRDKSPRNRSRQSIHRHGFITTYPLDTTNLKRNSRKEPYDQSQRYLYGNPRSAEKRQSTGLEPSLSSNLPKRNCDLHSSKGDSLYGSLLKSLSVVDPGGWATYWSPELAKKRQRGTSSSLFYSDSLDRRKAVTICIVL